MDKYKVTKYGLASNQKCKEQQVRYIQNVEYIQYREYTVAYITVWIYTNKYGSMSRWELGVMYTGH